GGAYGTPVDFDRGSGEAAANLLGEDFGPVVTGRAEHGRELLATEPTDDTRCTDRGRRRFGKELQNPVAHRMPEPIIDRLELIEVDRQNGRGANGRGTPHQRLRVMEE